MDNKNYGANKNSYAMVNINSDVKITKIPSLW